MLSIVKNEQQLLNCLLDHPKYIYKTTPHFTSMLGGDMFSVIQDLTNQNIPLTDTHIISAGNKVNSQIDVDTLSKLRGVDYDSLSFKYYAKRLRQDYGSHRIQNCLLEDTLINTNKKGKLDLDKLSKLQNEIADCLELINGKGEILRTPEQLVNGYIDIVHQRAKGLYNFSSGDSHLDTLLTLKFAPGNITTIFAATGLGKSAYALSLVNKQINKNIHSMYISLEMDEISTMDRLFANRLQMPASMFYPDEEGNISDHAYNMLEREREIFSKINHFRFVEQGGLSKEDIRGVIIEAKKQMKTDYLIVTIDLLTMIKGFGEKAIEMERSMDYLLELAKELNVHIVGVVQANRDADSASVSSIEQLTKLRPDVNNIKNTAAIAERSRVVLGLFRAKLYATRLFPDDEELEMMDDIMEVNVLKQNSGQLGMIKYLFAPEKYSFYKYFEEEVRLSA